MKELMELIKQKMMLSVSAITINSEPSEDQNASQACLILARTYEILYFLDKKGTAEPIEVEKEEN